MWTRADLKTKAKTNIKANYWPTFFVTLFYAVFLSATTSGTTVGQDNVEIKSTGVAGIVLTAFLIALVVCTLIGIFVDNPLVVGCEKFYVKNGEEGDKPKFSTIFSMFKDSNYKNVCLTIFKKDLVVVLWSLLFIIPGIIKGIEYSMVEYIIAENPGLTSKEAMAKSKEMMNGNKWKYFVLQLSFILWDLLASVLLGGYQVGGIFVICSLAGIILEMFWIEPYKKQTYAQLYLALNK